MTKPRKAVGAPNVTQRPASASQYQAQAAAGKYDAARPQVVAATYPPILAVGAAGSVPAIAVTQIQYLMAFELDSEVFAQGASGTIGGFLFPNLAPVGQGIPPVWSDDARVLQTAWNYTGGQFRSHAAAPVFTAIVELHGVLTVNIADVELEFRLTDPNNTPPNDIVAVSGPVRVRAINSPEQLRIQFDVDTRSSPQLFRFLPNRNYAVEMHRIDAGVAATVTLQKYRQRVYSVGVA